MAFVTRSEFREVLLSLYKDIQKLRDNIDEPSEARQENRSPTVRIATDIKLDPVSSIETRTPRTEQKQERRYQLFSLFVGILTLGAVVVYAVVTYRMWCEMQKETNITQEQFRAAQRPWIAGNHWELPLDVVSGSSCRKGECFGVYLINTGNSPALDVRAGANISTVGPLIGNVTLDLIRDVLANNDTKEPLWFEKRVSAEQLNAPHFYAQCRVQYCDIWNDLHETNFCLYHERGWPFAEFWPCREGGDDSVHDFSKRCVNFRSTYH